MRDQEIIGLQEAYLEVYEEVDTRRAPKEMLDRLNDSREGHMAQDGPNKPAYDAKQRLLKKAHERRTKISEEQEGGRRARKRYKNAPSYDQVKAGIDAKEKAAAERKVEREAARRPLTPGERYDQEKATKKDKSSDFSRHRTTGSGGHGSEYRVSSRFKEEFVINYLLDEGFASDEKSAEAILGAMSEAWVESIVEAVDPNYTGPSQDPLSRANRAIGNAVNFATGQQGAEVRAKQKGVPGNVYVKQSGPFSTKNVPTKGSFISDAEMKRRGQSTKPMGPISQ